MTYHDLIVPLRKRPFQPFRLFVSGGATFDVRHPELCVPGADSIFLAFPGPEDDELEYKRYTIVDMEHIIRLEPLPTNTEQSGKGKKKS